MLLSMIICYFCIRKIESVKRKLITAYIALLPLVILMIPVGITFEEIKNPNLDIWGALTAEMVVIGSAADYVISSVIMTVLILIGTAISKSKRKLPN